MAISISPDVLGMMESMGPTMAELEAGRAAQAKPTAQSAEVPSSYWAWNDPRFGDETSKYGGPWDKVLSAMGFQGDPIDPITASMTNDRSGIYKAVGDDENGYQLALSPKAKAAIDQLRSSGYDLRLKNPDQRTFNQYWGFVTPQGVQDIKIAGSDLGEAVRAMAPYIGLMAGPLAAQLGSTIGGALGVTSTLGQQAIGSGLVNAGLTAASGADLDKVLRSGITGLASPYVAPVVQSIVPSSLGALEPAAEKALTSAAMSGISGKGSPLEAALGSLAGSAIGSVSEGAELPPSVVKGALELAKTGTLSPTSLMNAVIGLNDAANQYQQQQAIEAAYADPSRALDVLQPPSIVRAEMPEDVYGAEGDVLGQDFYTPTEQGTSLDDLIRYIDQEASSGPRPTPENLQPAEDTWMAQPEPSEPDLFTPQTQQPRDEFVEPYMTTPAEQPTVAETPEPAPEPELFTPSLGDLKEEPVTIPPAEVAAPETIAPPPEIPVGPEEPTFDDLIRQLGLTPVEEVQPVGSVDEGYFVPPQGPTIEDLLDGIGPGIQEGMAPGVVAPPTIEEILASIPPGIEEGMVPGGLEREGIPATPEELQAVDQIISQPITPSAPVKIPTIPTAPTTPTAPKQAATSQQNMLGLMALMGAMGKKETPQRERNVADVSRGISMSPFGLPYGGRYG